MQNFGTSAYATHSRLNLRAFALGRLTAVLLITGPAILLFAGRAATAGTTWDGGGIGASWGTANNWSQNSLPLFNGTEAITIGNSFGSGTTLTLDGSRYINSLILDADSSFTIAAGTGGTINLRSGNLTQTAGSGSARTISAGIVLGDPSGAAPYTGTFNIDGDFELSITGNISEAGGSRGITLTGGRYLRLGGTNTFSGGVTLTLGTLFVSANENLGASSGGITLNGGNLSVSGSFTANRNLAINFTTGSILVDAGNTLEITGTVAGNGDLRLVSGGTLILSGSGSNGSGITRIATAGTVLSLRGSVGLSTGNLTFTGGVLELGNGNFTRGLGTGAGQVNMSGTNGAGFAAFGADRVVNLGGSGATVTWGSGFFINSFIDEMGLTPPLRLGSLTANATVDFQNGINLVNTGRNIQLTKGTGSGPDGELSGIISSTGVLGGITVRSTTGGRLLLTNGNNAYQGNTTINSGELWVGANATSGAGNTVLGSSTNAVGLVYDASLMAAAAVTIGRNILLASGTPGVATLGGVTADASTFSGAVTLGSNTTVGRDVTLSAAGGGSVTFSGVIADPAGLTGTSGVVTKAGAGTVNLSNNNTYSGGTLINAGTLQALADGALGGGDVTIAGGTATLTLSGGATNNYISNNADLNIVAGSAVNLNFLGTDSVANLIVEGVSQAPGTYGATDFAQFAGTGLIHVIPEPSTYAMFFAGAGLLLGAQRLRQKKS